MEPSFYLGEAGQSDCNKRFLLRQGIVLASISPSNLLAMNDTKTKPLSAPAPEIISDALATDVFISQLLHDFKNQLGGVKLYAAVLKKSLASDSLDVSEGIAICEKIIQQIDVLTARTKEATQSIKASVVRNA